MLYVANTGFPKNTSNGPDSVCTGFGGSSKATVGDGGLQKWINSMSNGSGTWSLAYTLYSGLNGGAGLVYNTDRDPNIITTPGTANAVTGVSAPQGVSVDASDNLYVTDPSIVIVDNRNQAAQLNFPATNVDATSATQVVTVTDAGNAALQVSNLAISANFAQEASGGTDCTSSTDLSAGGQCAIGVAFAPTQSGALTGTVSLSDNALNNAESAQTVPLSGGGTQVAQTITFSTNAPASAAYGSHFAVAAAARSGLAVAFTSSGVCRNVGATYTMTSGTGACTVIANQAGNTEYSAAPQVTQTVSATLASQTIRFPAPASPAAYNTSFAVSATSTSGLTVTIAASGVCSISSGTVTMTSGTGTCTLTASQSGNANYSAAPLSATQLDATASVAGTFVYSPAAGTVLSAGTHTLSVIFTPTNTTDYTRATDSVTLTVNKATPRITWATPAAITYGTALSATQLDSTASVAGHFCVFACSGNGAERRHPYSVGHLHPDQHNGLYNGDRFSHAHCKQGHTEAHLGYAGSHHLRNRAQCGATGRHRLCCRHLCVFASSGDGAERRHPYSVGHLHPDKHDGLHDGDRFSHADGETVTGVMAAQTAGSPSFRRQLPHDPVWLLAAGCGS